MTPIPGVIMIGAFAKSPIIKQPNAEEIALTLVLYLKRTKGSFMIGIVVTSALGVIFNVGLQDPPKVSLADLGKYSTIDQFGFF